MSKQAYLSRYLVIIRKLQMQPYATFEQIADHLSKQVEYYDDASAFAGISKRTFQRDLAEISSIFRIDIEYSRARKGYSIVSDTGMDRRLRETLESFEMLHAISTTQEWSPYLLHEQRPGRGTEHLFGIMHAIRNRQCIRITYQKYYEREPEIRLLEPYVLKEFRFRWYCLARDPEDGILKHFSLDRISHLEILSVKYIPDPSFNPSEYYRYNFGIMTGDGEKPQKIQLAFDSFQANYIKAQPLHSSQKILSENKRETIFQLELRITFDFIQELLMYGSSLKVIKPVSLARKLVKEYEKAAKHYGS